MIEVQRFRAMRACTVQDVHWSSSEITESFTHSVRVVWENVLDDLIATSTVLGSGRRQWHKPSFVTMSVWMSMTWAPLLSSIWTVMGWGVLGLAMVPFHHRCGVQKGALTSSFSSSSVSEPSPRAGNTEGKVAAVSSTHDPTAAIGRVWDLFLGAVFPELGPATVLAGMLTVAFEVVGVDSGGGWRGWLMSPVYMAASGKPFGQFFEMW